MAWINGTYVDDRPLGHPQKIFVAHDSIAKVKTFAHANGITDTRIDRVLTEACDEDNYAHDRWRTRLDDVVFEFHLARLKVELRSIKRC